MDLALTFSAAAAACYAALVILVARRGLRIRANQLFLSYLVTMLAWQLAYIMVSISESPGQALLWYRIVVAALVAQVAFLLVFVHALLNIRGERYATPVAALVWCVTVILLFTDTGYIITGIERHGQTSLYIPRFGLAGVVIGLPYMSLLGYGIVTLMQGYERAKPGLERDRLRYLLLAVLISLTASLANLVPPLMGYPVDVAGNIVCALLLSYAILRYRLLDISFVVRRGLAYSILALIVAGAYLLSIVLFENLVRPAGTAAFLVPVVLAMVAALLVQPWRERAQSWVDRLLFRGQYDSRRMLQQLSRQAATIIDLDILSALLLNEICETMHIERAALFLRQGSGEGFEVAAQRDPSGRPAPLRLRDDHPIVQWLQHSDRLLRSGELDMLPQFRSLWAEEKEELNRLGAELFIPLQVKNDLVGILAVGAKLSGEVHSLDDEITLSTLANQAAVAVEKAHLFATTKARVADLTVLQEIGVRLVSSRHLSTVLQVVVESGIRLLGADEAHVALYDGAHERSTAQRGLNVHGQEATLAWQSAAAMPLRSAISSGKGVVIGDLRLHAAISPALAREGRIRSVAAYPLKRGDGVIAVLAVAYHQPHTFTDDQLRLLGMLADQATLAIDNAQLLESEQAKRQLADTLREVSRVIGSTLNLDELLNLALEQLQRVVGYDIAAVLLVAKDQLELGASRGLGAVRYPVGACLPLSGNAFLRQIVQERTPAMIDDVLQDGRAGSIPEGLPVRSLIGVPLIVRDELRGVLAIGDAEPNAYNDDDLQSALAFANQAALAIENARLYQETTAEQSKTRTILEETFSGIVVTDVDLRIVTFNSGAEAITGFTAAEAIGRRLPDLLGPDIAGPKSPLGQVMARGERVAPQETAIHAAAGLRDILQGTVALYDSTRRLFGYLLSFADITRLKEVDRLKTDIVANVSHELRTPLASIKAYTELLLDNIEGEDRALRGQFLQTIDLEADRLSQLISDLLDLSRLEAGRFEVRKSVLDLKEVLANVLSVLEVQRRGRLVTIRTKMPVDLPTFSADRDMVTIIIRNLLANAIKFSHQGGEVLVAFGNSPDHLVLEVTDHGMGIPAEVMPHLFQKFYRSQAAAEMGIEGTGLGLVLTKQAVEAHGGVIEVESEPGVRTTFIVRLPWR